MGNSKFLRNLTAFVLIGTLAAGSLTSCAASGKKGDYKPEKDTSDTTASSDETSGSDSGSTDKDTDTDSSNSGSDNSSNSGNSNSSSTPNKPVSSVINTGDLTIGGNGYEGIKGTGDYNYGEALQKSLLFYELQRTGDLPENTRCNWRGDSCLDDGSDVGLDLSGGLLDAGDNVKFNLPMAYTGAMLGWSIYEDLDAYEQSGQLEYALGNVKWISDYLIKCHPEDEVFYYQVGDGNKDHSWWGPVEVINMDRPSYKVTKDNPGSTVVAEAAACLAVTSIVFEKVDPDYSKLCLEHAETLFKFANNTKSDAGYTAANGFYNSWSGWNDELAWSGAWLYIATGDDSYLTTAKSCYSQADQNFKWAMCWDDVHIGAALMLAKITGEQTYKSAVEEHLDWWSCGTSSGEKITYTPKGLAWLDTWGSLRYATTTSYIAAVYSEWDGCPSNKVSTYWDFAVSQANYALGSTGFSYLIGFGDSYPEHPHHRTSQGSYCDNMSEPATSRHTLVGALVGGPGSNDDYTDTVSNYTTNEVACDYNAGFTGLMAKLYTRYHGETIKDFGAVEVVSSPEFFVEASVNASGADFVEMRTFVYNETAWPARTGANLEYRYFVDLSEIFAAGGSADSVEVTTNYMQNGSYNGLYVWDEDAHIYYVSVLFDDNLSPRGQSNYKSELQIRMKSSNGAWDNSNDYSYASLDGSNYQTVALYDNGTLVFGSEPGAAGTSAGSSAGSSTDSSAGTATPTPAPDTTQTDNSQTSQSTQTSGGTANSGDISVSMTYDSVGASANSISGTMEITNKGDKAIDISSMDICYYLTNTDGKEIVFDCYHAALMESNGTYTQITDMSGNISDYNGTDCDTCVTIGSDVKLTIPKDAKVTVSFALHYSDWSTFSSSDDYSAKSVENIVITSGGNVVCGTKP